MPKMSTEGVGDSSPIRRDTHGYYNDEIVLVGKRKYMQQAVSDESPIS